MSEMKHEQETPERDNKPGFFLAIPFFTVLTLLAVIACIIPLRPTVSYSEKRELAKFPEFSWTALTSGSYFDDISTWYSDTFPGRETWVELSNYISSFHGHSDIVIEGSLEPVAQDVPEYTKPEQPEQLPQQSPEETEETVWETTAETEAAEEGWGGVDAGDEAEISLGTAIQIGDAGFNQLGFSQQQSDRYIKTLTNFAAAVKQYGVRVISCPAPTAVGVMVEKEYLEKLNCTPQDEMLEYLHSGMSDDVIKVDTFSNLVKHNDEYIYFRTDHHWTARGAYYAYEALCWELGIEPIPLEELEEWDQGVFEGSLYGKVSRPQKLRADNLYAYIPQGELSMIGYSKNLNGKELPVLQDMTNRNENEKYLTFICGDYPMVEITNASLPEGSTCVIIKDSFGNCFVPYVAQHYHKTYAIDYRKLSSVRLQKYVQDYEIDDVIFAPYLIATQAVDGNNMFENRCK